MSLLGAAHASSPSSPPLSSMRIESGPLGGETVAHTAPWLRSKSLHTWFWVCMNNIHIYALVCSLLSYSVSSFHECKQEREEKLKKKIGKVEEIPHTTARQSHPYFPAGTRSQRQDRWGRCCFHESWTWCSCLRSCMRHCKSAAICQLIIRWLKWTVPVLFSIQWNEAPLNFIGIHGEMSSDRGLFERWWVNYIKWRYRRDLDFYRNWITKCWAFIFQKLMRVKMILASSFIVNKIVKSLWEFSQHIRIRLRWPQGIIGVRLTKPLHIICFSHLGTLSQSIYT